MGPLGDVVRFVIEVRRRYGVRVEGGVDGGGWYDGSY